MTKSFENRDLSPRLLNYNLGKSVDIIISKIPKVKKGTTYFNFFFPEFDKAGTPQIMSNRTVGIRFLLRDDFCQRSVLSLTSECKFKVIYTIE